MQRVFRIGWAPALLLACGGAPEDLCDPGNNDFETAGCACEVDADCTCQVFTGAAFEEAATQSACGDDGTCIPCRYL
ncbi:MAG: hypothetical protein R3F59_19910 [Myxococcota bacterium]